MESFQFYKMSGKTKCSTGYEDNNCNIFNFRPYRNPFRDWHHKWLNKSFYGIMKNDIVLFKCYSSLKQMDNTDHCNTVDNQLINVSEELKTE